MNLIRNYKLNLIKVNMIKL